MIYITKSSEEFIEDMLLDKDLKLSTDIVEESNAEIKTNDIEFKINLDPDVVRSSGHGSRIKVISVNKKSEQHSFPISPDGVVTYKDSLNRSNLNNGKVLAKIIAGLLTDVELNDLVHQFSGVRDSNNKIQSNTDPEIVNKIEKKIEEFNDLSKSEKKTRMRRGKVEYKWLNMLII